MAKIRDEDAKKRDEDSNVMRGVLEELVKLTQVLAKRPLDESGERQQQDGIQEEQAKKRAKIDPTIGVSREEASHVASRDSFSTLGPSPAKTIAPAAVEPRAAPQGTQDQENSPGQSGNNTRQTRSQSQMNGQAVPGRTVWSLIS